YFPLDRAPKTLALGDRLSITEFGTDAGRIDLQVLSEVVWLPQRRGQLLVGTHHELAGPSNGLADRLDPCLLGQRVFCGDVVDAAGGSIVLDGERHGGGHILDVAATPPPLRVRSAEDD